MGGRHGTPQLRDTLESYGLWVSAAGEPVHNHLYCRALDPQFQREAIESLQSSRPANSTWIQSWRVPGEALVSAYRPMSIPDQQEPALQWMKHDLDDSGKIVSNQAYPIDFDLVESALMHAKINKMRDLEQTVKDLQATNRNTGVRMRDMALKLEAQTQAAQRAVQWQTEREMMEMGAGEIEKRNLENEMHRLQDEVKAQRQREVQLNGQLESIKEEMTAVNEEKNHIDGERNHFADRILVFQQERDGKSRELSEMRKENVRLSELNQEDKETESIPWTVIWCSITAVVAVMMTAFVFCLCHRGRARKYREEIMRLQRVIRINNVNQGKDDLIVMVNAENGKIPMEKDQRDLSPVLVEEHVVRDTLPSKYGESFDVMVENMGGVEDALMDGIMEEMVTEGEDYGDEFGDKNARRKSIDKEGFAATK